MAVTVRQIIFRDLLLYFALALFVCILSVLSIGVYSYYNFKELTNQESTNALNTSFAYERENLGYINSLHSIWTRAYENIALNYDEKWIANNIGNDVSKTFGMDLALILEETGKVVFGASRGILIEEATLRSFDEPFANWIQAHRTTRFNMGVLKGVIVLGGKPYLAAIGEIQPSYDASVRLEVGRKPKFLFLAQDIEKTLIRSLRKFTTIDSLSFTMNTQTHQDKGLNSLPVTDTAGIIGYFLWEPAESAKAILSQIVPVSLIVFLILIVLAALIGTNMLRVGTSYDRLISNLRMTTQDLGIARDKAEKSSREKSNFLATMSHEIRTPMNGIVGMLSLLRETEMSQRQIAYVNTIQSSSNSLMKLIDDILEFSQSEQKEQKAFLSPVNIREIVTEIQGLLQPVAIQRDLKFEIFFSQSVPTLVNTDAVRFRQILLHLTSNAFKFTSVGHVRINVNTAPLDQKRYELIVQVIDTGVGIPDALRVTLFTETFSRDVINADATHQSLGLGIAKNLVTLLGGKIDCDSTTGQGSVFWFAIPIEKENIS